MAQLFSYWHSVRYHGGNCLGGPKLLVFVLLVSGIYGQGQPVE